MYEVMVESKFAAAHQLRGYKGKCENLHGHNWKIEVVLQGDRLDEGGVLLDFGVVKTHLREVMATVGADLGAWLIGGRARKISLRRFLSR